MFSQESTNFRRHAIKCWSIYESVNTRSAINSLLIKCQLGSWSNVSVVSTKYQSRYLLSVDQDVNWVSTGNLARAFIDTRLWMHSVYMICVCLLTKGNIYCFFVNFLTRFHLHSKFFCGEMKRHNLESLKRTVSVDSTLQVRGFRYDKTIIRFSLSLMDI